jgi:hypothetical protein
MSTSPLILNMQRKMNEPTRVHHNRDPSANLNAQVNLDNSPEGQTAENWSGFLNEKALAIQIHH